MQKYQLITPEGTRDYLFEEAALRSRLQQMLADTFSSRGYHEVVTPSVEFLDVFTAGGNPLPVEQMYKLTDAKGRLMVMRPDNTTPIARLCASRLKGSRLPLRLYYSQPVFLAARKLHGQWDEMMQSGIELIGVSNPKADFEVLVTAAKALENLPVQQYSVEIGHIGVFHALINELTRDSEVQASLLELIDSKNYPALNDLLDGFGDTPVVQTLKQLPRLFGGEEVFARAREWIQLPQAVQYLDELEQLYRRLCALGLESRVSVDLGIVNSADYYTGVVFKGYIEGSGVEVLSGGRYDGLHRNFGEDMGAVGFAVKVDAAVDVLLKNARHRPAPAQVLVHCDASHQVKAMEHLDTLTESRIRAEFSVFDNLQDAVDYAREQGIPRIDLVGDCITSMDPREERGQGAQ